MQVDTVNYRIYATLILLHRIKKMVIEYPVMFKPDLQVAKT